MNKINKMYYCWRCDKYFNSLGAAHGHANKHTPWWSIGNVDRLNKYIEEREVADVGTDWEFASGDIVEGERGDRYRISYRTVNSNNGDKLYFYQPIDTVGMGSFRMDVYLKGLAERDWKVVNEDGDKA